MKKHWTFILNIEKSQYGYVKKATTSSGEWKALQSCYRKVLQRLFERNKATIKTRDGQPMMAAKRNNDLYLIKPKRQGEMLSKTEKRKNQIKGLERWHKRLGHLNVRKIKEMHRQGTVTGMDMLNYSSAK
ncbi:hypothetical protein RUM43_008498 [Polyplax serrata]|uniref:GAG-pre-integrase domain-containing protein n=1 Tax=Polyplax serrata TaxID=468196 RepID=A0AAN8NYM2_POLSC